MKPWKIVLQMSILFLAFSLSACSNTNKASDKKISSLKSENASLKKKVSSLQNSNSKSPITASAATSKKSNIVGVAQYTITSYEQKKVLNKESNYTDAEENDDNVKDLGKNYYRIIINYQLKNTGSKPFDLSTYSATILDDNNIEFNDSSSSNYLLDDNSNGIVQPHTSTTGKFILLSKNAPSMKNFKINISEQSSPKNKTIGESGIISFK